MTMNGSGLSLALKNNLDITYSSLSTSRKISGLEFHNFIHSYSTVKSSGTITYVDNKW